jgi:hypothetical protein
VPSAPVGGVENLAIDAGEDLVESASVASASRSRNARMRTGGSRFASASRSSGVLYSRSSSESEWEYGRVTLACTNAGLRSRRMCATALPIAR